MLNKVLYGICAAVLGLTAWFGIRSDGEKLFVRLPASQSGVTFANQLTETDSINVLTFEYMYNGAGVGVGDFNRDGRPDLYFAGNQVSSRLYLNQTESGQAIHFADITGPSGTSTQAWCTGVSVADVNQDGWPDIYVCVAGPQAPSAQTANRLFINDGPTPDKVPTFTEQAADYGLADTGYSTQAVFFDYDRDGDLDCYLLTNALESTNRNALRPKRLDGEAPGTDRLYENISWQEEGRKGEGRKGDESLMDTANHIPVFRNVSRKAGILTEGYGLGVCLSDLDDDGWPDIYCANDFLSNDLVWMSEKGKGFSNQAARLLKHQTHNGMGVDIADLNNDALPDIVVLDMLPPDNYRQKMMLPGSNYNRFQMEHELGYEPQFMRNTLQLHRGTQGTLPTFSEIGQLAGIEKTDWSWAPLLADFDNDGWKDVYITNGYRRDVTNLDFIKFSQQESTFGSPGAQFRQAREALLKLPEVMIPNYAYRNRGKADVLSFENVSEGWGLSQAGFANGAAYVDLDNDGDLDLVTNNIDAEATVLENRLNQQASPPNWLRLTIEPSSKLPVVIGTKVWLYAGNQTQMSELAPVRGFVSTVENALHFGLGPKGTYDSIVVRYPNGKKQILPQAAVNQVIEVAYQPIGTWNKPVPTQEPVFVELALEQSTLNVVHTENPVVDFDRTPLLPHKYSQNGPQLAVGDINGDGLDDFFTGTDFGHFSQIYIQKSDGKFASVVLPESDAYEDAGAVFFDADGDGDQDLYVVSGGSKEEGLSPVYQDRLYLNEGGTFHSVPLPPTRSSGSCVVAADFDGDGDLDIFRGGRVVPGQYPKPAASYLLRNEGLGKNGKPRFGDLTDQLAPGLRQAGLVTAALWTDIDNDARPDLLVVGEWMAPTLFRNTGGNFKAQQLEGLENETGWWQSLTAADFDGDGDTDYVAGNLGLNSKYRASATEPVRVFAADYDNNGRLDPLLTFYLDGQQVPVAQRDVMVSQIPSIRKRFPTYHDYASYPFEEMFTEAERQAAFVREARQMASCYLENTGDFRFKVHPLPIEAQMAPVTGVLSEDFTGDGQPDLLLAGNFYGTETIGGRLDAGKGVLLVGQKADKVPFRVTKNSGLNLDGDVKSLASLRRYDGSRWYLVGSNDGPLRVLKSRRKVVYPHF